MEVESITADVVSREAVLESLRGEFDGITIPAYKFRSMFDQTHGVFFDCEEGDFERCLEHVLKDEDHSFFTVFFVVEDVDGGLRVMDVSFPNIGKETLEHFMGRYHSQLKPSSMMGLEASGRKYVKHIGFSYEE